MVREIPESVKYAHKFKEEPVLGILISLAGLMGTIWARRFIARRQLQATLSNQIGALRLKKWLDHAYYVLSVLVVVWAACLGFAIIDSVTNHYLP